jgi:hypothetical protein
VTDLPERAAAAEETGGRPLNQTENSLHLDDTRAAARRLLARGLAPLPVLSAQKRPVLPSWQNYQATPGSINTDFNVDGNIGVILGRRSTPPGADGVVVIDLDSPEALAVAPLLLPPTPVRDGREGVEVTHWWYGLTIESGARIAKLQADDPIARSGGDQGAARARLLELLGDGQQVLTGPSQHPSGVWYRPLPDGPLPILPYPALVRSFWHVAAGALLARYWPRRGGQRHDLALALAGFLLRGGVDADTAARIIRAAALAAGDEDEIAAGDRSRAVHDTAARLDTGQPATGWPSLVALADPRIAATLSKWLGVRAHGDGVIATGPPVLVGDRRRGRAGSEDDDETGGGGRGPNQATTILRLCAADDLFHDAGRRGYASTMIDGVLHTYDIAGAQFRLLARKRYYDATGRAPSQQAVTDAVAVMTAQSMFRGPERAVAARIARVGDTVYIDLGDPSWRVVEVTAAGWRVIESAEAPVRFRRPAGLLPLAEPVAGGDLSDLFLYVNVRDEADRRLLVLVLVASLAGQGPYPLLALLGGQGSAKSTAARVIKALLDPSDVPLRAPPKDERDVFIGAANSAVLVFDNLSSIPAWLSDGLCRLATGGGFATRTLYENDGETRFSAMRPVVITAIGEVVSRSDLLDRVVLIDLPSIAEEQRRSERELWGAFEVARGRMLGRLLDGVVAALRHTEAVRQQATALPRLADFGLTAAAAGVAYGWSPLDTLRLIEQNRAQQHAVAIEASPVADLLLKTVTDEWRGTATELLAFLNARADDGLRRAQAWPRSARSLSSLLRRIQPNLAATGLVVEVGLREGALGTRIIRLTPNSIAERGGCEVKRDPASAASAASVQPISESGEGNFGLTQNSAPARRCVSPLVVASAPAVARERAWAVDGRAGGTDADSPGWSGTACELWQAAAAAGFPVVPVTWAVHIGAGADAWQRWLDVNAGAAGLIRDAHAALLRRTDGSRA